MVPGSPSSTTTSAAISIIPPSSMQASSTIKNNLNGHAAARAAEDFEDPLGPGSVMSIATMDSYHTATTSAISSAYATEGGSTIRSLHGNFVPPLVHRFTLLKPGAKQKRTSGSASPNHKDNYVNPHSEGVGWNPLEILFSSKLLSGKCDLCGKRIGWKPVLECDDCGIRFVFFFVFSSSFLSLLLCLTFRIERTSNAANSPLLIAVLDLNPIITHRLRRKAR